MISSTTSTTSLTPLASLSAQSQTSAASTASKSSSDSVHLSPAAQATAMRHQGMSVKAIAASMGVSTAIVNSYLGTTTIASVGAGGGSAPVSVHSATSGTTSSTASTTTATKK